LTLIELDLPGLNLIELDVTWWNWTGWCFYRRKLL